MSLMPVFFCFYNHGHAGGVAEGSEGIVVTSQPNRNPYSLLKAQFLNAGRVHFSALSVLILSHYSYCK